jgi:hypothetical protein
MVKEMVNGKMVNGNWHCTFVGMHSKKIKVQNRYASNGEEETRNQKTLYFCVKFIPIDVPFDHRCSF